MVAHYVYSVMSFFLSAEETLSNQLWSLCHDTETLNVRLF